MFNIIFNEFAHSALGIDLFLFLFGLVFLVDLAALEVDMLCDQTGSECLADQCWVFCRSLISVDKQAVFAHIIHNHVFKFDIAHVTLFVEDAQFLKGALSWNCTSLISQLLALSWVRQRVLHSLG